MRSLWILPVIACLAAASACADDEEPDPTRAPPTPTSATIAAPTVTATSDDWSVYDAEFGDATFQYPSAWTEEESGSIYSWDVSSSLYIPPDGIKLQPSALPVGDVQRPSRATDFQLGSLKGWELLEDLSETGEGAARTHTVALDHEGTRYTIVAYFGPDADGEALFAEIVSTFELKGGQ